MDRAGLISFTLAIVFGILTNESWAQRDLENTEQRDCPPGKIWGGHGCEIPNLCSDGTLPDPLGGCPKDSNVPPEPPSLGESGNSQKVDSPSFPDRHACENGVLFYTPESQTDVFMDPNLLLVNGPAEELFNRYLAEFERRDKEIQWANLKIVFWEEGMDEPTQLREGSGVEGPSLPKALTMRTRKDDWKSSLEDKFALALDHDKIDFLIDKYQADAICGR